MDWTIYSERHALVRLRHCVRCHTDWRLDPRRRCATWWDNLPSGPHLTRTPSSAAIIVGADILPRNPISKPHPQSRLLYRGPSRTLYSAVSEGQILLASAVHRANATMSSHPTPFTGKVESGAQRQYGVACLCCLVRSCP